MRYLHFGSVRGDLQEGNGCSSRCQSLYFRAHKRHFCALLAFGTPVFGHFEHKIEVFVLFWPSEPSFSGFSSTKSRFLCSFTKLDVGVGGLPRRQRHRRTCGAVAPAQPILPLTQPSLHLHSRCTFAAVVPAQPLCHLPSPVAATAGAAGATGAAVARRCICGAAASAQPILPQPTTVAPDGACGLGYHSGLGGGVEDVVD